MKTIVLLLLSCVIVCAQETRLQYAEDPAKTAKRIIGEKLYDVNVQTNLWKLTTGKYLRPQLYTGGWVVSGSFSDKTNFVFVLKNPPKEIFQRFTTLKSQYQQIKPNYDRLLKEYDQVRSDYDEETLNLKRMTAASPPRPGSKADAQLQRDFNNATERQQELDRKSTLLYDDLMQLKSQIDGLNREGFDLEADFTFSCYATRVIQTVENLPVYDRGRIVN
jgi:hypothetical protein